MLSKSVQAVRHRNTRTVQPHSGFRTGARAIEQCDIRRQLENLQRTHGNRYVQQMLARMMDGKIQGKSVTGTPGEPRMPTGQHAASQRTAERSEYGYDPVEQTFHSGSTSGNSFSSTFDPTTSAPTPNCDRIVITQSIRMFGDGVAMKPGTYYTPFKCRDATALADGTYLDHGLCSYTTPYPVDRGIGTAGKSNSSGSSNATYSDSPLTSGGDKGFKSATNPTGWSTVTYKFENYALCASGVDCVAACPGGPTWYDGVAWEYTKTASDHAAGGDGTASATASLLPPSSGATILKAFDLYNSVKGFVPC